MKYSIITRYSDKPFVAKGKTPADAARAFRTKVARAQSRFFNFFYEFPLELLIAHQVGQLNALVVDRSTCLAVGGISNNLVEQPVSAELIDKMRGGTEDRCWFLTNIKDAAPYFDRTVELITRLTDERLPKLCGAVEDCLARNEQNGMLLEVELVIFNEQLNDPTVMRKLMSLVRAPVSLLSTPRGDVWKLVLSVPTYSGRTLLDRMRDLHPVFDQFCCCVHEPRKIALRLVGSIDKNSEDFVRLRDGYSAIHSHAEGAPLR